MIEQKKRASRTEAFMSMTGEATGSLGNDFTFDYTPAFFEASEGGEDKPREAMVLSWLMWKLSRTDTSEGLLVRFTKYSAINETGMRWRALVASLEALESCGLIVFGMKPSGQNVHVIVRFGEESVASYIGHKHRNTPRFF